VRDVFISYSKPDYDCAFELVARVEQQGIDCWIAPRDIAPSADWAAEIIEAISRARLMILVFSGNSNESPQVRREVERAVHKQVSILPFRIESVLPSKSLEYFLSAQHWMDAFPPPREPHYERLCTYLKTHLCTPASAPPLTANPIAGGAEHSFGAAQLQHIERQLAEYIGPLAKHLVKTAAMQSTRVEDLVARLATELDTEADRREFAQRCHTGAPAT
jgi:TIR domain